MTGQPVPGAAGDRLPDALVEVAELVEVRERAGARRGRADRWSALLLGVGYVVTALACALRAGDAGHVGWADAALALPLVALYVIAYRTEFVATSGSSVPTEPVLVAMLLLLPLPLVPLTVLVALQLAGAPELRAAGRYDAVLVQWATGWHCLGPVAVLWAARPGEPSLAHAPVYLAALLAQFVVDAAVASVRTRALGVPVARLVQPLARTFATDALLAPIGLAMTVAGGRSAATVLLLAAPIGLVRLLARDRTEHLRKAVTITSAFSAAHEEARVDSLTGLANRRAWEEAVDDAERQLAEGSAVAVTVLAADLDGLKYVNDTFGHEAGDDLISGMAGVLRTAVPDAAAVARLGGDEFAVLVVHPVPAQGQDAAGAARDHLVAAVRAAMAAHRGVEGTALSASLGVATVPPEGTIEEAARTADLRAAEDKSRRRAGRR